MYPVSSPPHPFTFFILFRSSKSKLFIVWDLELNMFGQGELVLVTEYFCGVIIHGWFRVMILYSASDPPPLLPPSVEQHE